MPAPLITVRSLDKSFDSIRALRGVDLDVHAGTIHALVGENGAGKSTLGKILAGVYHRDAGEITLRGEHVAFRSPADALAHGVTIVAQEIALVGTRSVVETVFLGSEPHRGPFVDGRELRRRYDDLVEATGICVPPDEVVDRLTIADQQKVEILRALARRSEVIVMDEPTARLATHEAAALMETFRQLRARGTTILFVSHFLDEVLSVADTVTVLRDGALVDTRPVAEFTHDSLIESMIGRSLEATFPAKELRPAAAPDELRRPVKMPLPAAAPVLIVEGLRRAGVFEDVSFTVGEGEIVVLAGLVGSGRSEVVRALFGADPVTGGAVHLDQEAIAFTHPAQALKRRVSLIPESRKTEGLFLDFSLTDNIVLPVLRRFVSGGVISARRALHGAEQAMASVGVKAASGRVPATSLSGGNQQKVLFARSLLGQPRLLIADEPTRGVDVGAKRQIYELVVDHARSGMGVVVVSSEMEEVIGLAHKVVVMRQGRLAGQLTGADINESSIARLAFGQNTGARADAPQEAGS